MDELKMRILAQLKKNALSSNREIGDALGVHRNTVARQRKALEKSGVIKKYTIDTNDRADTTKSYILITLAKISISTIARIEKTLLSSPIVVIFHRVKGRYSFVCQLNSADGAEVFDLLRRLSEESDINTETFDCM